MKIILSESQFINLIKEATKTNPYIDDLLDKILAKGMSSLSNKERNDLEKLSRGQDINYGKQEKEQDIFGSAYENHDLFMEIFPDHLTIKVDDEDWHLSKEIEPHGEFEVVSISCDEANISFMVNPFAKEDVFEVVTTMNTYGFKINDIPKDSKRMELFVDRFIKADIPKIIRYIKKKE